MEQIKQLKQMRDDALSRLQNNPDYKLFVSLDRLIREMEQLVASSTRAAGNSMMQSIPATPSTTKSSDTVTTTASKNSSEIDKAFDSIASELQSELKADDKNNVNDDIKSAMAKGTTGSSAQAAN